MSSRTYTTTFTEYSAKATRRGRCPGCGKSVSRSTTFVNTASPFNKREDGQVRTPAEVQARVDQLAADWTPEADAFYHERCRGGAA